MEEHLQADIQESKLRAKSIQFMLSNVPDLRYHFASKNYLIDEQQCDYLCYVDPGKNYQSYLIFVLSTYLKNCSRCDDVFCKFLKSFSWGGNKVIDEEHPDSSTTKRCSQ